MIICANSTMFGVIFAGIVGIKHRHVHPRWGETRALRITTRIEPMTAKAALVHDLGMRRKHVAERIAGNHRKFAGFERRVRGLVKLQMAALGCAYDNACASWPHDNGDRRPPIPASAGHWHPDFAVRPYSGRAGRLCRSR